jgi:hypothetical protein
MFLLNVCDVSLCKLLHLKFEMVIILKACSFKVLIDIFSHVLVLKKKEVSFFFSYLPK